MQPHGKPFSESCERNQAPILGVLLRHFDGSRRVLEIGSGTGQHAVHFARHMPWVHWQPTDRPGNLAGIRAWVDEAGLPNLAAPRPLWAQSGSGLVDADTHADVHGSPPQPRVFENGPFDAVFTANTLHIMGWDDVQALFAGLPALLAPDAVVAAYGPFNYGGCFTSQSNRRFEDWLKARDARSGIRDFEAVDALARGIGLQLVEDVAMPANNRMLLWRRA